MLYLAWAWPLLLLVAVVTPPWQNPDEPAHMLRISQIAHGGLLGYRFGSDSGGIADPAIWPSINAMNGVIQHQEQKVSLGMLAAAGSAEWGAVPVELGFANTAQYPPVLYAPAVLAVEAGRLLRLSVVNSLIAGRIANAIAASLIAACALSIARRTRLALAALLVLPMIVALFASVAPDGLMIAVTLAAVACVDRVLAEERDPTLREAWLIGVMTAVVIITRPPYLPMAALPLVCARQFRRRAWLSFAAIFAVSVMWTAYILFSVSMPLMSLDPATQLQYLLHRPWIILPIAVNSLVRFHRAYSISFIGVLGWLSVGLPQSYYIVAWLVLLLAFASVAAGPARRTWVSLLICLAAFAGVHFAMYLTWTQPQADHVDGVQGRYFLPLAAVLALAVPAWQRLGEALRRPALVALLGFAVVTPVIIINALVLRYYLVP
jgi:uncharacterized membrane protein